MVPQLTHGRRDLANNFAVDEQPWALCRRIVNKTCKGVYCEGGTHDDQQISIAQIVVLVLEEARLQSHSHAVSLLNSWASHRPAQPPCKQATELYIHAPSGHSSLLHPRMHAGRWLGKCCACA